MASLSSPAQLLDDLWVTIKSTPTPVLLLAFTLFVLASLLALYPLLHTLAPKPRAPLPSEKTYLTSASAPNAAPLRQQLPCWYDRWAAGHTAADSSRVRTADNPTTAAAAADSLAAIEAPEVAMTVVVPAYNEEARITPALEEMVTYLDEKFGRFAPPKSKSSGEKNIVSPRHRKHAGYPSTGYEILIVNDGSTDSTVSVVLDFSRKHGLHDLIRVITLEKNRGKGGGVTHGMRHARGAWVVFADADGASKFSDLGKLLEGCMDVVDGSGRGVAIGSRGHLVGSEAVVKRSPLRNLLMRSFHALLTILTPPATSRIRDTQCGFKLFSRAALPHIIPYMHAEGWIFDIEMLMLAESAPPTPIMASDGVTVIGSTAGIRVAEVPIGWNEVEGSKMNLVKDSISMAVGLAVLRASWMLGVYRRRVG